MAGTGNPKTGRRKKGSPNKMPSDLKVMIINALKHELFYFAVAGIHTKLTLIKTECGQHIVIGGSANLRSSLNVEQITIDNNEILYDFHKEWMSKILNKYHVKHTMMRRGKLWQLVAAEKAVA